MPKGLISEIKENIKRTGANKGKFLYFRPDEKIRVRFLNDMDEGMKILFHDSFEQGVNVPCQEYFGRDCDYCSDESLRHRDLFLWCVYDYEAKEVKIIMGAANNFSPIPALVGMYEAYGTLIDRDYVITRTGKGQNTSYTVVPMDKVKLKNKKAKPYSEKSILKMLDKAYPPEDEGEKKNNKKKGKRASIDVDDDDNDDEELDYDDMSAKELYKLCKDRDIKCKLKKDKDYYIELLEEYDEENEEDDDEEW